MDLKRSVNLRWFVFELSYLDGSQTNMARLSAPKDQQFKMDLQTLLLIKAL